MPQKEQIKQWFFGVETEADWRVGGELVHRGEYHGKPYIDKGTVLGFDPPRRMVHTHWSDVSGKPDTPDNYQNVAWDLTEHDGGTKLTITERNLPSDEAATTSEQARKTALGTQVTRLWGSPDAVTWTLPGGTYSSLSHRPHGIVPARGSHAPSDGARWSVAPPGGRPPPVLSRGSAATSSRSNRPRRAPRSRTAIRPRRPSRTPDSPSHVIHRERQRAAHRG